VDVATPVGVDVTVSPDRAPLVSSIALSARDALANKTFEQRTSAATHVHFEIPARMTLPGASLAVHVRATDAHDNELATTDLRVRVGAAPPVAAVTPFAPAPLAVLAPPVSPSGDHAFQSGDHAPARGGFWHSPWPYILGGVVLAAGGTAIFFAARSTADVNVGPTRVEFGN
jgi:hypothetical protein